MGWMHVCFSGSLYAGELFFTFFFRRWYRCSRIANGYASDSTLGVVKAAHITTSKEAVILLPDCCNLPFSKQKKKKETSCTPSSFVYVPFTTPSAPSSPFFHTPLATGALFCCPHRQDSVRTKEKFCSFPSLPAPSDRLLTGGLGRVGQRRGEKEDHEGGGGGGDGLEDRERCLGLQRQ
ncbi:hypothetical protein L209DRAFT_431409 [Thermothelomyces heterothallicus CBS 203.75]